jgi:serine/threonine protein phosphatase PrpC
MLDVTCGQASHPGKIRSCNEDAMGAFLPASPQQAQAQGWMFVVADGVGGMDLGDVASARAVDVMLREFALAPHGTLLTGLMPRLVQYANAAVHDDGLQPSTRGKRMATTVVACALRHDQVVVTNVGDSRCYQVRRGKAVAVTHDHTVVAEQRRLGLISAIEAEQSEFRHILTRALGPERFVSPDTTTLTLKAGDMLVLCSDPGVAMHRRLPTFWFEPP